MKILFADKFPADALAAVNDLGYECALEPDLGAEDLAPRIAGVEVLVVRSTRVSAATVSASDVLKLVIRAGAGTNTIDTHAARVRGIPVCNVPGKNAVAVAELTLGLILSIDRNIPDNVSDLRAGTWNKRRYSQARGIFGQSIGIVGMGAVGTAVAERARAFGLEVLIVNKVGRAPELLAKLAALEAQPVADLDEMASRADILTFHVPAGDDTRHVVNERLLAKMKPGSMIINTSRGDVLDEPALIRAMDSKGIRAGVDVYEAEPASDKAEFKSRLASHPSVYGTHHIGASTAQAQNAVAAGVVEILSAFTAGTVLHCVNQ